MTHRTARFLTRLYPPAWRTRYGEEFRTFLESRRVRPVETLGIVASALSERLAGAFTTQMYACLAAIAPGGALFLVVSSAPLPLAIDAHRAFWLCWAIIEAGSLAIAAAGVVAVTPAVLRILRSRRRDVIKRLVWPGAAGLMLLIVLLLMLVVCVAMPGRESLERTLAPALICVAVFVDAVSRFLSYVIAHSKLSRSLGRVKCSVLAMASWIIVASVMAAGYGLQIHHSTKGGIWGLYWIGSLLWLVAMTYRVIALRLTLAE